MMKEFKTEDIMPLEAVKSKIWMMFDILRSENISSDDYHLVLFLLSAYKDNLFSLDLVNENHQIKERLIERLRNPENELHRHYAPILESFEPSIQRLSEEGLKNLLSVLVEINERVLTENYRDIFDSVLYRISQSQGRYAGEFIQPVELTRFICGLADLKKDAKIFNPFAGLASFGVYLDHGQDYFGQELNRQTWALGALRLMAYERPGCSRYVCDDSILHWPAESEKFDLILSHAPFGVHIGPQYRNIEPDFRTIEDFLIEKGIQSLNQNGKLIAILPQGFLYKGGKREERLRRSLVDNDLLDTIISLPGGLLFNTGISLIVLVINKNKERPGKVRFIIADKFIEKRNPREKILNDDALNSLIHGSKVDEDALRIVDNAQIKAWDYNLNVPRYFHKEVALANNEQLVKLKDILEYVRGHRGNLPENGKLVRIRDLRDDKLDFHLNVSEINDIELQRSGIHQINETCLLLAIRWRTLKPTYFIFEETPIYTNNDILSFRVNESIVDFGFLINELKSDYVQEQLESFRMGVAIPFIRRDDLLEVAIKLPSLEEQKAKVKGIYELSREIKNLQDKLSLQIVGESQFKYERESALKHRLGTPLLNIGSSLRNIEKALSRNFNSWEGKRLNEKYDVTLSESFKSIYQTLEMVHRILIANENEIDFSNKKLEEIDFLAFIRGYVNSIKSAEKSNVNTEIDIHPDIKIQLKNKVLTLANTELLRIGLNTIVENANMHAFTDDSKKYKLEFRISLHVAPSISKNLVGAIESADTFIKVELANNGKPFPKKYLLEKLIRKNSFAGETGNTGQGGFDLNEIIKYHNNGVSTLELITDDFTTEFTTTYSFLIPLNR
jgi:type I restriction enzyme M protein